MNGFGLGAINAPSPFARAPRYRLVKKSKFPGRGLGQDDDDSDLGISESDYESDQYVAPVTATSSANAFNPNLALTAALQAAPSILQGTAQVVKAANTPGQPISGVVTSASGVGTAASPSGGSLLLILLLVGVLAAASSK